MAWCDSHFCKLSVIAVDRRIPAEVGVTIRAGAAVTSGRHRQPGGIGD